MRQQYRVSSSLERTRGRSSAIPGLKCVFGMLVSLLLACQISLLRYHTHSRNNNDDHPTPAILRRVQLTHRKQRSNNGQSNTHALPLWIQHYLQWHTDMRAAFPGRALFDNPNAPNLLIRTCLGLCGGLNDRLGQLPWDLYLANQTNRVLLLHWHRPVPLEHFLQPNQLDWTVPHDIPGFFPSNTKNDNMRSSRQDMKVVRAYTELFAGYNADEPNVTFWEEQFDLALQRATSGEFRDKKILRHRLLGHLSEDRLEERLLKLGETDLLHWTPSFGKIFYMFFRPSDGVQTELDRVYESLQIAPGEYSAVHCRVRHPKAYPPKAVVKGKDGAYTADKTGLPWEGEMRLFAISTATRAIKCAQTLNNSNRPLYFFSDSSDLVQYISHERMTTDRRRDPSATFANNTRTAVEEIEAFQVVHRSRIVARNTSMDGNAHIDKQKGRRATDYYSTFVDLFLAANARCVTFGVGFFAIFASKISGTSCKLLYTQESWGSTVDKTAHAKVCSIT